MENLFKDFKVINIDPDDEVVCDLCNKSWKDDITEGGYVFSSKAVCPDCVDDFLIGVKKYNEEKYIKAKCPEGISFYNFILQYRKDTY